MKKIIFILAVFVSFVANAQYTPPTGYTNINSRYDWLAGVFRALGLPAGGNAAFTTGQAQRAGAVYYDSTGADAGLYVWSGSAWVKSSYTDADARAAISLTTTGTSGAATYSSATGVFNIPDYSTTASQGITKTGSDFQLGGTITSKRTINVRNGVMEIDPADNAVSNYFFTSIDTVSNPDNQDDIPIIAFGNRRTLRYPSYAQNTYRGNAHFEQRIELKDSANANTVGGDFMYTNQNILLASKMSGYSGRSALVIGDKSRSYGIPINLNKFDFLGSTSTSNHMYVRGYVVANQSYLLTESNDTLTNWIGYGNWGFLPGGYTNWAADFEGGFLGYASASRVGKHWGLHINGTRTQNFLGQALGIGDSTIEESSLLDVSSTTKGVIWPRMTATQRNAISSPATGLMVFDTDSTSYFQYNGSAWQNLYNTGSGSTPTLQQVLTSGSTLTGNNTITNDYVLSMTGNSAVAFGDLFSVTNSSTTGRAINAASAGTNSTIQAINTKTTAGGGGALWAVASGSNAVAAFNRDSSSTATVVKVVDVTRTTSGTAADGIGASIHFNVENQSGLGFITNSVESIWKNSIDVSKESFLRIRGLDNAVEKVFMDVQTGGVVIVNDGADTLATKAYARSVGGGGGSGTVNSGTQYRLGYYATTGTAISEAAAITANRALISDANGVPTHSATTATELGYVSGVTSSIQTQLDAKATGSITQNWFDDDLTLNGVTTKINRADFFDDMLTAPSSSAGTSYMLELASGTGADASIGGTVTPPNGDGWATMSSGTTTTGAASLASTSASSSSGTKNKIDTTKTYRFETNAQIETLADGTDRFRVVAGLAASTTNTTGTNMIWFRYSDDVNSGNWTCYSADGTTTESTSSGVAAAAGTTVRLGFEYDNAQIRFYINGSLVATHTTRLPEHNSQSMFPVLNVTKSLGTTNRNVFIDYVKYRRL